MVVVYSSDMIKGWVVVLGCRHKCQWVVDSLSVAVAMGLGCEDSDSKEGLHEGILWFQKWGCR